MTNYKNVLIYCVVFLIVFAYGALFGHGDIPNQYTAVSGILIGVFLGIIGRAYFWGDDS